MTKEEFINIVKQFNIDKIQYNWNEALSFKKKLVWKNFKAKLINFPTYYEFKDANEFKYWLLNSEKSEFIEERFCPICGNFIEKTPGVQFRFYNGGCCKEHSKIVRINKIQKSNLEKYGCISPMQRKEVADKVKATNLAKYGTEFPLQNKEIHQKTVDAAEQNGSRIEMVKKVKATKLEKYGNENYNNAKSISKTKLNWTEEQKENYVNKTLDTKKKNGTLNTSHNFEDKLVQYLRDTYPDYTILTQYKTDPRYPYACDCYIKDLDLFIEFQGSYFHNFRPFNNSPEHIKEYEEMVNKGGLSENIAKVWRYTDVEKRKIAKENNLNYLEYWEDLRILPEDILGNNNNLVLYFQQDIFYKQNKEQLFDPIARWKYYKNAVKHSNFYEKHHYVNHLALLKRPYISKQIGYSSFDISLCKLIDSDNNIIYDPCGGWGHRLIGFKDSKHYIYNDINTDVVENCKQLAEYLNKTNITFYNQDAGLPIQDIYDIVFTCPPYYNKEFYTEQGAENYTEEEFINWWNNVLDNLHPTSGKIYIVINSNYLKYFTSNTYSWKIVHSTLKKSHFHKDTKTSAEIVVEYTK